MSDNQDRALELATHHMFCGSRNVVARSCDCGWSDRATAIEEALDAAEQRGAERAESALEQARHAHTIELGNARAATAAALKEASQAEAAVKAAQDELDCWRQTSVAGWRYQQILTDNLHLRVALAMVEWVPEDRVTEDFASYCPWCGNVQSEGHASDCPRQAALKGTQG